MRARIRFFAWLSTALLLGFLPGCAAQPFPEFPSPAAYAETDGAANHSDTEEITIETIAPAPETQVTGKPEENAAVPEAETIEIEEPIVSEVPAETDTILPDAMPEPEPNPGPQEAISWEELLQNTVQSTQIPEPELSDPISYEAPFVQQQAEIPDPHEPVPQPESTAAIAEPVSQPAATEMPVITLSGETLPAELTEGSPFVLRGIIRCSPGNLIKIHAALINSAGKAVQQCIYAPGTEVFNLEGTVNVSLLFGSLPPGEYSYLLNAEASNEGLRSERELINQPFTVAADPAREAESDKVYTARFTNDTSNAGRIWNRFINEFGNPYAAAAILGNIAAESSFIPCLVEGDTSSGYAFSKEYTALADSGTVGRDVFSQAPDEEHGGGYGLCQWTAERKGNLYDYAKASGRSVGDLSMQCDFIVYELFTFYPDLYDTLKNADNCSTAVFRFCNVYEQAAIYGTRNSYAQQYLEKYGA